MAALSLSLSKNARAAIPIIRKGISSKLSGSAIANILAEAGMGIRRQTLFDIIRSETNADLAGGVLSRMRLDARPDPFRAAIATTEIRSQYSYTVRVSGADLNTLETRVQHIQVTSDELLTRREIEDTARNLAESDSDKYRMVVVELSIQRFVRAGERGIL